MGLEGTDIALFKVLAIWLFLHFDSFDLLTLSVVSNHYNQHHKKSSLHATIRNLGALLTTEFLSLCGVFSPFLYP